MNLYYIFYRVVGPTKEQRVRRVACIGVSGESAKCRLILHHAGEELRFYKVSLCRGGIHTL